MSSLPKIATPNSGAMAMDGLSEKTVAELKKMLANSELSDATIKNVEAELKRRGVAMDQKFEARIYEKAEHWNFDTTVEAKDEADARKKLLRDYPRSEYTIQDVRAA